MDDDEELANENDPSDSREDNSMKVDLDRLLSDVGAFGR